MTIVKQKVYLISEKQREALLNYLLDRPYREVAIAVQILAKAPSTNVDIDVPEEELEKLEKGLIPDNSSNSQDKDIQNTINAEPVASL
jgi:hypothetical protein